MPYFSDTNTRYVPRTMTVEWKRMHLRIDTNPIFLHFYGEKLCHFEKVWSSKNSFREREQWGSLGSDLEVNKLVQITVEEETNERAPQFD